MAGLWTITAEPRDDVGLAHVMMRSGDLARTVIERYADNYIRRCSVPM